MRRVAVAVAAVAAGLVAGPAMPAHAAVSAHDLRGQGQRPCPPVDTTGRFVTGGCRSGAYEYSTKLSIRTVFGAMSFGDCTITFDVSLARDGRFWADDIGIGGESPCNDIRPCAPARVLNLLEGPYDALPLDEAFPWKGRLRSGDGGSFEGRLDVCFDTCVGRYAGPVDVTFRRGGEGWAMRIADAGVGTAGLAVDGTWDLTPGRFALSAVAPSR